MPLGVRTAAAPESSRKPSYQKPLVEPMANKVAIFEDSQLVLDIVIRELRDHVPGISFTHTNIVESADESMAIFLAQRPHIVVTDLELRPGRCDGFEILARIRREAPETLVALSSSTFSPKLVNDSNRHAREFVRKAMKKDFDALFHKADLEGLCAFIRANLGDPLH